jgi:hypothetical protein
LPVAFLAALAQEMSTSRAPAALTRRCRCGARLREPVRPRKVMTRPSSATAFLRSACNILTPRIICVLQDGGNLRLAFLRLVRRSRRRRRIMREGE